MAVAFTRTNLPGTEEATLFYENERDPDAYSIKEDDKTSLAKGLFPWENRSLFRRRILQAIIGVLGIIIIIVVICTFAISFSNPQYTYLKKARFKLEDKEIEFRDFSGKFVFSGSIGRTVLSNLVKRHSRNSSRHKFATDDGVWLILTESQSSIVVNWTSSTQRSKVFVDCLSLVGSNWYGGSEIPDHQRWPIVGNVTMAQYVPQNGRKLQNGSQIATFGSVLERYWLNSNGMAVIVDYHTPLHVSINENGNHQLCLKSDPIGYLNNPQSTLVYTILTDINPKILHLKIIKNYLGYPKQIPSWDLIRKPIWTITVEKSDNKSQTDIEQFASNIGLNKLPCGHFLIRGHYSGTTSTFDFDAARFPNPKSMIKDIISLGCNMSLHIQPHLKITSKDFFDANKQGLLVASCDKQRKVPGLVSSKGSLMTCIDITSNRSKTWLKSQLEKFKKVYELTAFEFSGGDVSHLPYCFQLQDKKMDVGWYSTNYAQFASSMSALDTSVGYRSQTLPTFVKMSNKMSDWVGLRTLIPTVLSFGIMGYPFVLPSVIGGNSDGKPDKELYIRWLQASLFLPAIQFAIPPWIFDQETIETTRQLLALRSNLYSILHSSLTNVTRDGAPVIRPLWWMAPNDRQALVIDSQFMFGDLYMVAPVLEEGQTHKRVYLPVGKWQQQFKNKTVFEVTKTGRWQTYKYVTLDDIFWFKLLSF